MIKIIFLTIFPILSFSQSPEIPVNLLAAIKNKISDKLRNKESRKQCLKYKNDQRIIRFSPERINDKADIENLLFTLSLSKTIYFKSDPAMDLMVDFFKKIKKSKVTIEESIQEIFRNKYFSSTNELFERARTYSPNVPPLQNLFRKTIPKARKCFNDKKDKKCFECITHHFFEKSLYSLYQSFGFRKLKFIDSRTDKVRGVDESENCYTQKNNHGIFVSIAESDDYRIVTFRGSTFLMNWIDNFSFFLTNEKSCFDDSSKEKSGLFHGGFCRAYSKIRQKLLNELSSSNKPIIFNGHSLGAGLAQLALFDLHQKRFNIHSAYLFASPSVGNEKVYLKYLIKEGLHSKVIKVKNGHDIVAGFPFGCGREKSLAQCVDYQTGSYGFRKDSSCKNIYEYYLNNPDAKTNSFKKSLCKVNFKDILDKLLDHSSSNYFCSIYNDYAFNL